MNYTLLRSDDLGVSYNIIESGANLKKLRKSAQILEKSGSCRWVITSGNRIFEWCGYIDSLIKTSDKNPKGVVATDDLFAKEILVKKGIKVFSFKEMISMSMVIDKKNE